MDSKPKWWWLGTRIKARGFKTNKAFAVAIGIDPARIAEMVSGKPIKQTGKFRKIPQQKIPRVAKLLDIPVDVLLAYNNDIVDNIDLGETAPVPRVDTRKFLEAIDTIQSYMRDNQFAMTPEQKLALVSRLVNDK